VERSCLTSRGRGFILHLFSFRQMDSTRTSGFGRSFCFKLRTGTPYFFPPEAPPPSFSPPFPSPPLLNPRRPPRTPRFSPEVKPARKAAESSFCAFFLIFTSYLLSSLCARPTPASAYVVGPFPPSVASACLWKACGGLSRCFGPQAGSSPMSRSFP